MSEDIKESPAMKEFETAWKEFFENKPHPKNDDQEKKELEEFYHWYNYVRKQSDTGKTPVEMYIEIYGEEPNNFDNEKPSRFMNFGWDEEEYGDDEFDERGESELDNAEEEGAEVAGEIFEKSWKQIKQEVEGQNKKGSCKYTYVLGFLNYMKIMNKQAEQIEKEMKDMSDEETKDFIKKLQEERDE